MPNFKLHPATIEQEVIDCQSHDAEDLIGACVKVSKVGEIEHAALFIRFNDESKIFHYTSKDVLLEDADSLNHYYFRHILFIPPELIPAFMAQCELITEKAQPLYGYFYDGSLYDEDGNFISPGDAPQTMTCVGFCLSVIKHFIGHDNLLHYQDWNYTTLGKDEAYMLDFYEKIKKVRPTLSIEEFKKHVRRILPIEYFTGAFADKLNVRKTYTDLNWPIVKEVLSQKRAS